MKRQCTAVLALTIVLLTAVFPTASAQLNLKPQPPAPEQKTAATGELTAVPSPPTTIPMEDIALKAAEVTSLLRSISEKLPLGTEIETIRDSLADASATVARDAEISKALLGQQPPLPILQEQQQQWQRQKLMFTEWLELLRKRSKEFQDKQLILADLQTIWTQTLNNAEESQAPDQSLLLINDTVKSIGAARVPLKEQLALVLDLQSRVGREVEQCSSVLAEIARLQQASVSDILARDSLPLWSARNWAEAGKSLPGGFQVALSAYRQEIGRYFTVPSHQMPLHAGLLAVLASVFLIAGSQVRRRAGSEAEFSPFTRVFDQPIAAALVMTIFVVTVPYHSPLSATTIGTFQALALVPMIMLVRPLVPGRLAWTLSALGLLFACDTLREILLADHLPGQLFLVLESLTGLAVLSWLLRQDRSIFGKGAGSAMMPLVHFGAILVLLHFAGGGVAAASGYVRLARVITPGIIAFGVIALAMYAALRVCIGLVAFALQIWPLRLLRLVRHHRLLLEQRLYRLLLLLAVFGTVVRYLGNIGLLEPVVQVVHAILTTKVGRGGFSLSAAGVIEFVLTVWAAYLLSTFLRFILQEDVYPRIRITRGKSYAVSSLLHYLILTIGFIIAIAALGVDLTKLTVLTGALGIGIGFGLQSVVSNFVSGLILLFERPIQVGDTVEVGIIQGKVRRIGIRASTVHTRQGADIIVPNSQLVTEKVTNWTFTDQLKRIDLPVGVSYKSPPKLVIALLESVARQHPHVLTEPAPQGLFVGFGESALNFELRAWTDQFDDWHRIQSELATALYDAVLAAGMTFPFPQREVRLLKDAEDQTGKPDPV